MVDGEAGEGGVAACVAAVVADRKNLMSLTRVFEIKTKFPH